MNTPLFGLAVVSLRWGRPMIYKEHLQMGAIWDLRQRSYTCFTAYPLFGDPEEDEFMVEMPNKLIVTPFDIKDGYAYIYFKDDVEEIFENIAKESGFDDVKIRFLLQNTVTSSNYGFLSSKNSFLAHCHGYCIYIYTYFTDELTDEEFEKRFSQIKSEWNSKYSKIEVLGLYAYKNKIDYDKNEEWIEEYDYPCMFIKSFNENDTGIQKNKMSGKEN